MVNKKYRRTKKKLNKRKLYLVTLIILTLIISIIYNIVKSRNETKQTSSFNTSKIDKCIVIDAGHGGEEEPGCVFGNIYEKTICLEIASELQELLTEKYSKVIMTRTEDVNVYLNERARIANRENADIFVSIHLNALEDDNITSGIETWYNPEKDDCSNLLADTIQEEIIKETGATNLGLKESTELIVTKNTQMASCLVEAGFLSSTNERQKLLTTSYQNKIAIGIYNGIVSYFNKLDMPYENIDSNIV